MADITINIDSNITGKGAKGVKDLNKELKKVSVTTKNLGTSFKSVFTGALAANVVASAFSRIGSAAKSLASNIVDTGIEIEQIQTRFQTLTGSVENADKLLRDLTEFAASTPFQLPGLADASAQLLSFGFAQEEIIDKLGVLGNVASGSGSSINELTLIFGQVAAAGKLTGERLLQLQERAIPIGAALAKTMDVPRESVRKLVSEGKVGFKEFEKAFNSLTQEGGLFFEATIRQSKTLGGIISTLGDNFTLAQNDIAQQFLPAIKDVSIVLIKFLQDNKQNIEAFAKAIADSIPGILTFADVTFRTFSFLGRAVGSIIETLIAGLAAAAKALSGDFSGALSTLKNEGVAAFQDIAKAGDAFSEETLLGNIAIGLLETQMGFNDAANAAGNMSNAMDTAKVKAQEFTEAQRALAVEGAKLAEQLISSEQSVAAIEEKSEADRAALKAAMNQNLIDKQEFDRAILNLDRKTLQARAKLQQQADNQRAADQSAFFGKAKSLANSQSKELQAIGKAAALAEIAIQTPPAIASSFRFGASIGGPPLGFVFGGIAAAAQASQAAAVAGLQTGLTSVPAGFPNDSFPAALTTGERVVNTEQNQDLTGFIQANQANGDSLSRIESAILGLDNRSMVVNVGGRTIVDTLNDEIEAGARLSQESVA